MLREPSRRFHERAWPEAEFSCTRGNIRRGRGRLVVGVGNLGSELRRCSSSSCFAARPRGGSLAELASPLQHAASQRRGRESRADSASGSEIRVV
ncbi:unnamed protein product [Lampetra planeri]